jgi:hypothetical protein
MHSNTQYFGVLWRGDVWHECGELAARLVLCRKLLTGNTGALCALRSH